MNFFLTKYFKKQLKKYAIKDSMLTRNLENALNTFKSEYATSIGKGVYKIRVRAQNKGKSGGYRVYLLLLQVKGYIVPLCIYSKHDKENLSSKEFMSHLEAVWAELSSL